MASPREHVLDDCDPSALSDDAQNWLAERYQTIETLHVSAHSQTLVASHLRTERRVVVKWVAREQLTADALFQLRRKAELLRELDCPWIGGGIELVDLDSGCFWISDYLKGTPLTQRLAEGRLQLPELVEVARSLFRGLKAAHGKGILHGAINPGNLITWKVNSHQVLLTDFGINKAICTDASRTGDTLQLARYLPPECAGLIDHEPGPSSDLYAAGVVLFEAIAARPLFESQSLSDLLRDHLSAPVPSLRVLGCAVPQAFEEIIQRLLRKDPRDRYQSAEAVLADVNALTQAMLRGESEPEILIGAADRRTTLTEPAFVARQAEIAELDQQVEQAQGGNPRLVYLESESGQGKSRLLRELSDRATGRRMLVAYGQGADAVVQRPYQILEGVVNRLVEELKSSPERAARLHRDLHHHAEMIASLFPQFSKDLDWTAGADDAPEAFGEARSLDALVALLNSLGTEDRPAIVILDDFQWADELAQRLIGRWLEAVEKSADKHHVAVVVGFRAEEVDASHPLRRQDAHAHIRLEPLTPQEVRRVAESMAGILPDQAVGIVQQLAEGSPFMAGAVLRGLVESKALIPAKNGWEIEAVALEDLQSSQEAAAILSRRIELLRPETIELLSVGAVLGKEFETDVARELAGRTSEEAEAALADARRRNIVWHPPGEAKCTFLHDKLRQAFLDRMTDEERQLRHLWAAEHYQATAPERVFELAYHFDAAGHSDRALEYALEAAESARRQHSLAVAEDQYRIARRGLHVTDDASRFRVAEGLGDVVMLRGRYDEAEPYLQEAANYAPNELARAKTNGKLGELAFKRGDMETATQSFESTLRMLGRYVPRAFPLFIVLLLWEVLVQTLHSVWPSKMVGRKGRQPDERTQLALRMYSRLAHGYWFVRGPVHVLWTHLRGMNQGERFTPSLELAQSYSEHAPAMSLVPWFQRGIDYAQKSYEIRKSLGDVWGQGQSLHYSGVVFYTAGRFKECIEKCREAVRLLGRTGDYWEMHIARYQWAAALYRLGNLEAAVQEAKTIHESGIKSGDEQASGISLDVWSRAAEGDLPKEIVDVEVGRERHDAQGTAQVLLAHGVRLIHDRRLPEAVAAFGKAIAAARDARVMNAYISPNLAWQATALRMQAESLSHLTPTNRDDLLRQAAKSARRAVRVARKFPNDLPHALRERALIAAARGQLRSVRKDLQASIAASEQQGAKHEQALSRQVSGRLGGELGWRDAESDAKAAAALLKNRRQLRAQPDKQEQPAVTVSLVDRFDTVLDAGRRIASGLSTTAIFASAQEAAERLLHCQDCQVLPVDEYAVEVDSNAEIDDRLIQHAVQSGKTMLLEDLNSTTNATSAASALAAPISVRGRTVACLLARHESVRGLFGPHEIRLADFVGTIAGAALENAEGFEQLQDLNRNLEDRVRDRTEEVERANRAKTDFLANMSHEIRTPLNAILGFADILRRGYTESVEERQEHLDTIYSSGRHLLHLINEILDLSKVESGQMTVEQIECPPHQIISEAVKCIGVRATEKGLTVGVEFPEGLPPTIETDPARLRQVITNLVGNAIKFTETGGVRVVARADADKQQLRIDVIDTGVGIPADAVDQIFQPFVQADGSITRRFGGTGLGLAISKRFAEALGGTLAVTSELDVGSTFTLTIATGEIAESVPCDSGPQSGLAGPREQEDRLTRLSGRVLLVDDGDENRRLLRVVLERAGIDVTEGCNGQEAVDLAGSGDFDLVLLDMQMPVMDGYTAAGLLREQGHAMPIVALTAHAMNESEQECRDAGCSHFLPKPVNLDDLMRLVAEVCPQDDRIAVSNAAEDDASTEEPSAEFTQFLQEQVNAMYLAWGAEDHTEILRLSELLEVAAGQHGRRDVGDTTIRLAGAVAAGNNEEVEREFELLAEAAVQPTPTPPPVETAPVLQPGRIVSTLPLGDVEFQQIVTEFIAKFRERLPEFRSAVNQNDRGELASLGHWLKGSGGTMGFPALQECGRKIEAAAKQNSIGDAAMLLTELDDIASRLSVAHG